MASLLTQASCAARIIRAPTSLVRMHLVSPLCASFAITTDARVKP